MVGLVHAAPLRRRGAPARRAERAVRLTARPDVSRGPEAQSRSHAAPHVDCLVVHARPLLSTTESHRVAHPRSVAPYADPTDHRRGRPSASNPTARATDHSYGRGRVVVDRHRGARRAGRRGRRRVRALAARRRSRRFRAAPRYGRAVLRRRPAAIAAASAPDASLGRQGEGTDAGIRARSAPG